MNYKCVWIVSFIDFFSSLDPPGKIILSTAEEISTLLLKLLVAANIFFYFATHEAVKVTADLLLWHFEP